MIPVNIATEDELSEFVLRRLLAFTDRYSIGISFRRGGFGYLKKTAPGWNRAAASIPVLILTDLDQDPCPSKVINDWLIQPIHPNLVIRVAVREVESWLLADSRGLASYLSVRESLVPERPDELPDPKAKLIGLAERSRLKDIRSRVVPKKGSTAKQGPDYNSCLAAFVIESWDVESAVERSPSLKRAFGKFGSFTPIWS